MINPKTGTAQDEQDIRKLKEVFATGSLKKDAKLRASIWTEDGTVTPRNMATECPA